ncbi:hypothetical protein NEOLEDRAFT_1076747 [Neolentinus lepideus HHB14362 ss-1]|uniref:Wax synthase domain-containing protein n=1 Tax=Neolentinus lepideus HHB14362 ss-1 TaxID=1314782 RepID=A0A165NQ52_9AGAM|nr:hypothetical protein NEOLEDRAFT_1076747 [Neolentinus lepideus HHB14362 ss-1]
MDTEYKNTTITAHSSLLVGIEARRTFSSLRHLFLPTICLAFIVSIKPGPFMRLTTSIIYTAFTLDALTLTTGDPRRDFSMGTAMTSNLATAIHLLWMSDPVRDFRHGKVNINLGTLPTSKRWYWMLCVLYSPRGIGWNYQVANVPLPPCQSRWQFVLRQVGRALGMFLLVDIAQTYMRSNSAFTNPTPNNSPFTSQGYLLRCINIIAWLTTSHGTLNMNYTLLSAVFVAIGLSEPKDWPDLFGSWTESYTVRRYWGRTWHQLMRRYTSSIGRHCAQSLRFKRGTKWSSYTQLYVGFIVSGLVHMGGDCMVGGQYIGSTFPFFIAQAVIITVEDMVIRMGKRVGIRVPQLMGYLWVFAWFMLSRAWYIQWAVDAGMGKKQPFTFSMVQPLLHVIEHGRAFV